MFVKTFLNRLTLRRNILPGFSNNVQCQRQNSKLADKLSQPMKFSTVYYLILTSKYILAITFVTGIVTFYVNRNKKKRRLEGCTYLKSDANFKVSNLRFVEYKKCILLEDMFKTGAMETLNAFEARPGDVFVASFPKSGTTWLQEVVYQIYSKHCKQAEDLSSLTSNNDKCINCKEVLNQASSNMEDKFPYLENVYPGLQQVQSRDGGRLLKTHLPIHLLPPSALESGSKIIYIYRNPKDVVVSYYYFARMVNYVKYRGTFNEFLVKFLQDKLLYSPYFPHLFGYIDRSSNAKNILILCYEDMIENPAREVLKVVKFLGIDLTDKDVEDIVESTSFESMRSNPNTNYSQWDEFGIRDRSESTFMRKGVIGDHKSHLDSEFNEAFDQWISKNLTIAGKPDFKFKYGNQPTTTTTTSSELDIKSEENGEKSEKEV